MGELVLLGRNTCTILWLGTVEFLTVVTGLNRRQAGDRDGRCLGALGDSFLTTPADPLREVSEVESTVTFEADIRLAHRLGIWPMHDRWMCIR